MLKFITGLIKLNANAQQRNRMTPEKPNNQIHFINIDLHIIYSWWRKIDKFLINQTVFFLLLMKHKPLFFFSNRIVYFEVYNNRIGCTRRYYLVFDNQFFEKSTHFSIVYYSFFNSFIIINSSNYCVCVEKMASNESQRVVCNEKRAFRENKIAHYETMSKSINRIVKNSKNVALQAEISEMLNVKIDHRKRNIQSETFKLMKDNFQAKCDGTKHSQTK